MSERDRYTPSRDDLWRLPEVTRRTGLRRSAIYQRVAAGTFPRPVKLTATAVAWRAGLVLDWMKALPESKPSGMLVAPRKPQSRSRTPEAS